MITFENDFSTAMEMMRRVEPFYDARNRWVARGWRAENININFMRENNGLMESDFYVAMFNGESVDGGFPAPQGGRKKPIGAFVAYPAERTADLYRDFGVKIDFSGAMFLGRVAFVDSDHHFGMVNEIADALKKWARSRGYKSIVGDAGERQVALRRFYGMLGAVAVDSFIGADKNKWIVYQYGIKK